MHTFLHNLISYSTWANNKAIESLNSCPEVPPKGLELLSHILQNNWFVLELVLGKDDVMRWYDMPDYTLEECIAENPKIDAAYKDMLTREDLNRIVRYVDYSKNVVERTVTELAFHPFDHCSYHRGQIAMVVRAAGGEPAQAWYNRWVKDTNRGQI